MTEVKYFVSTQMKSNRQFFLLALVFLLVSFPVIFCVRPPGERPLKVIRVIEGNIIVLHNGERVRFIGVDTPPKYECLKLDENAERLGKDKEFLKAFSKKSAKFTQKLCKGKRVKLEYDQTKQDKYGRLLAYVYLPNGKLLNEEIILQGYGFMDLEYPFKQELIERLREAQRIAKEKKRGLWSDRLED